MIDLTAEIDSEKAKKQLASIRAAAAKAVSGTISEFERLDFYIDTLSGKIGRFGSNMNLAVLSARLKQAQLMARDAVKATSTGKEFEQIEQEAKKLNDTLQLLHTELGNVQNTAQGFNPLIDAVRSVHREVSSMIEAIGRINPSATPRTVQSGEIVVGPTAAATSAVSETSAVKAQKDIYDQLVDTLQKVSYSKRDIAADIAKLKTEMAGYKATIDAVNKSERYGSITELQANKRANAIVEYERNKNAVSALSKELAAQIRIEGEERNSITQLNASLAALQSSYDKLSQTDRDGALGQQLNATIGDLQQKILGVEAAMQAQNSTLGTYGSGFNALGFQIQQVARELPALAYGPQVFISALSNNLPMLADEMARARKEINLLKKEGKEYVPLGKQIAGSIFSWQTLLVAGVTIFTMYSKEITAWVRSLFKGRKEIDAAAEAQKQLHKTMGEGLVNAQQELTSARLMYKAATDATKSYDERRTAAQKLIDQYPAYLSNMSAEQVMLGNAKTAYEDLSKAIIATSRARAAENELVKLYEAEASASLATEYRKRAEDAKRRQEQLKVNQAESQRKNRKIYTDYGSFDDLCNFEGQIKVQQKAERNAFNDWLDSAGERFEWVKDKGIETFDELAQYIESTSEELSKIAEINYTGGSDKNNAAKDLVNQAKQVKDLMAQLAADARQAEVDAMAEGTDKILAQINLDYDLREDEIKKREAELRALQGGKLTEEQDVAIRSARRQNDRSRTDSRMSALFTATPSHADLVAEFQAEEDAWNEYLIKYGNFQERVLGTTAKYQKLIEEAKAEGEKLSLEAERDAALGELEAEASLVVQTVQQMTAETINNHLSAIEALLAEAEDALSERGSDMSEQEKSGYLQQIAMLKAQISALQREAETRAKDDDGGDAYEKWAKRAEVINDLAEKFKNLGAEIGGAAGEAISTAGEVATGVVSIIDGIKQFGTESINAIQTASTGVAKAIALVEASSVILTVVSAVIQVTKSLVSLFGKGADYSDYEALKAKYEDLNEVWDKLLDKKREYIDMSYGAEVDKVGQEAIDIVKKQIDSYKELGKARLNSGASSGSHSIGVRQKERMSASDREDVREVAAKMGFDANPILSDRMTALFDLTSDQLAAIRDGAASFWAKLDDDVREYLDSIIEAEERIGEIHEAIKERWTQISFDELKNSFLDSLMDMSKSAKDFADDFSEYLMRAMLTTKIGELYEGKLQEWYDAFAESNKDGNISDNEIAKLREEWDAIVNGAVDLRDQLAKVTDYGIVEDAQTATARGFQTMSQETGSELNGRFTDIQGKITDMRAQGEERLMMSRRQLEEIAYIRSVIDRGVNYAQDTRDVLLNISGDVSEIRMFAETLPRIHEAISKTNRILDNKL